jgi:hypothetical protein
MVVVVAADATCAHHWRSIDSNRTPVLIHKLPDTLDDLLLDASPVRTPGLHLSQIIRSILQSIEPKKYTDGPVDPLYTDPGFTFERVLETAWASRRADLFRPGEFERDGVLCSPDYLDLAGPEPVLIESKMTEMSMIGCPTEPKFRKWLWQIAAYCHVLELKKARLHVLWMRGDYKKVRRAYEVFEITWEQSELEATWLLLTNHAREKGWLQ